MAKRSRIYRTIPKYMQKKAERVNKMINAWDAVGLTSNDLELAKELLSDFYENIGKTLKDKERASERLMLKKSEKEEYNKILDFIIYNDEVDLSRRHLQNAQIASTWQNHTQNAFETVKDKFSMIQDEQDFIDFIDKMNKMKNNRVLSALMDSDQYAALYDAADSQGMKYTEINRMLMNEYNKTGRTYDELFEKILDMIEK